MSTRSQPAKKFRVPLLILHGIVLRAHDTYHRRTNRSVAGHWWVVVGAPDVASRLWRVHISLHWVRLWPAHGFAVNHPIDRASPS